MAGTARATFVVFSLFSAGVLGGAWTGSLAAERARDPYASLGTLVRVLGLVERAYVDEVDPDKLVQAAIEGVVKELDPHSRWMNADEYAAMQRNTEGSWTGIGVELQPGEGGAVITKVLPGSPAAREGLQAGDRVVEIDGLPVDADHPEAADALYGERGEVARLRVLREGWEQPAWFEATRDEVHEPSVDVGFLEGSLAYARLILFQRGAAGELERALARLSSERPLSGLILDLRDNPGGLLDEAVSVADLFLDDGVIVSTWGRLESERAEHRATAGGVPAGLPVVVLINGYSASASEIVAAALQETGRANLIGTRTYGKGSVQTMYEHRDGSALKLTIGRYYTPSGNPVAPEDGRAPDLVVAWPVAATPRSKLKARLAEVGLSPAERDELTALVDALPDDPPRGRPAIPFDLPLTERPSRDPQLAAALLALRAKAN